MEPLSLQIYNAITDRDVSENIKHRHRAVWIWTFLFGGQSPQTLQTLLQEIEDSFHDDQLNDQQLLEFSWKAETVELLLREVEVAVV